MREYKNVWQIEIIANRYKSQIFVVAESIREALNKAETIKGIESISSITRKEIVF